MLKVPGEQQVSLMVTVVEVNRAAAREIGVNFNLFNHRGIRYFGNQTGQIIPSIASTTTFNPLNPVGVIGGFGQMNNNLPVALDNGQVQLAISALRELHYARTLSEPNLVTMNGQPANFMAGDLFPLPYVAAYTTTGLQGISYYPVGVQLQFTPFITDKDRIRLQINAEVSDRDLTTGDQIIAGNSVPVLTTRNFNTTVELRQGQTIAVAGLIQNKLGAAASRVPFFGDLPLVGRAFAFDAIQAEEQELVILITPELVHPMERHNVPPLPGSDIFEPGDIEFYLMGRLESRRSYDYRSPVMTDLARMCKYHKCEQLYIAGPHGHSMSGEIGLPPDCDQSAMPAAPVHGTAVKDATTVTVPAPMPKGKPDGQ
jgi:pilus assembly protein CpaC